MRGPGSWNFDIAMSRRILIKEQSAIELRAEAFNILNHVNLTNPTTTLNSTLFGKVTSALDPRIMQFALKLLF